jgi:hypothetical protein
MRYAVHGGQVCTQWMKEKEFGLGKWLAYVSLALFWCPVCQWQRTAQRSVNSGLEESDGMMSELW